MMGNDGTNIRSASVGRSKYYKGVGKVGCQSVSVTNKQNNEWVYLCILLPTEIVTVLSH